jgi:hypothetical protein
MKYKPPKLSVLEISERGWPMLVFSNNTNKLSLLHIARRRGTLGVQDYHYHITDCNRALHSEKSRTHSQDGELPWWFVLCPKCGDREAFIKARDEHRARLVRL